jgi:hypothetical protein
MSPDAGKGYFSLAKKSDLASLQPEYAESRGIRAFAVGESRSAVRSRTTSLIPRT